MYILRRVVNGTKLYPVAAKFYHFLKNELMRITLTFSPAVYLPPIKVGGDYKSQYGQDFYLERLGLVASKGFFVEIGSNDPIYNSNSYYLEKKLDWSGVSIDAIDYSASFLLNREKTTFVHALINETVEDVDFYHVKDVDGWENQVSSVHKETLNLGKGFDAEVLKVRGTPLSKIHQINKPIDLCLIDVEGHEISVLRSIDFQNNPPKVLVVENNGQFHPRKLVVNFLKAKGYQHVARIGTIDDIFCLIC